MRGALALGVAALVLALAVLLGEVPGEDVAVVASEEAVPSPRPDVVSDAASPAASPGVSLPDGSTTADAGAVDAPATPLSRRVPSSASAAPSDVAEVAGSAARRAADTGSKVERAAVASSRAVPASDDSGATLERALVVTAPEAASSAGADLELSNDAPAPRTMDPPEVRAPLPEVDVALTSPPALNRERPIPAPSAPGANSLDLGSARDAGESAALADDPAEPVYRDGQLTRAASRRIQERLQRVMSLARRRD